MEAVERTIGARCGSARLELGECAEYCKRPNSASIHSMSLSIVGDHHSVHSLHSREGMLLTLNLQRKNNKKKCGNVWFISHFAVTLSRVFS